MQRNLAQWQQWQELITVPDVDFGIKSACNSHSEVNFPSRSHTLMSRLQVLQRTKIIYIPLHKASQSFSDASDASHMIHVRDCMAQLHEVARDLSKRIQQSSIILIYAKHLQSFFGRPRIVFPENNPIVSAIINHII